MSWRKILTFIMASAQDILVTTYCQYSTISTAYTFITLSDYTILKRFNHTSCDSYVYCKNNVMIKIDVKAFWLLGKLNFIVQPAVSLATRYTKKCVLRYQTLAIEILSIQVTKVSDASVWSFLPTMPPVSLLSSFNVTCWTCTREMRKIRLFLNRLKNLIHDSLIFTCFQSSSINNFIDLWCKGLLRMCKILPSQENPSAMLCCVVPSFLMK